MDKLSRLEHIIKRLASDTEGKSEPGAASQSEKHVDHERHSEGPESEDKQVSDRASGESPQALGEDSSSLDVQFGRLVINDSKSYYVGNVLWANLANEVRPHATVAMTTMCS